MSTDQLLPRRAVVTLIPAILLLGTPASDALAQTSRSPPAPAAPTVRLGPLDAVELPAISVETVRRSGDPGTAFGPVPGYVARQSAAGTKTDTPLIETPQSVTVIPEQQLRDQQVQSVSEALRYAPGVQADANGFDQRSDSFTIRGFDVSRTGLFMDGLRLFAFGGQGQPKVEPYGLERIDILRGPGSVLYGQSGPGGVVDLVSKRPQDVPIQEVELSSGSYGRVQGSADLGGKLNDDGTLLYRLTGIARRSDTFIDYERDNRLFIAPAITWRPSPDTTVTLLVHGQRDEAGTTYVYLPLQGTLYPSPYGAYARQTTTNDSSDHFGRTRFDATSLIEHRFDDRLTVRQSMRYLQLETAFQQTTFNSIESDLRTADRSVYRGRERAFNVSLDNQAEYRVNTGPVSHQLLAGVDAQVLRGRNTLIVSDAAPYDLQGANPGLGPLSFSSLTHQRQSLDDVGFYLQDQAKIMDRVVLTLSGRYDLAHTVNDDFLSSTTVGQHDQAFTARAGITYLGPYGLAPYFSYAESFQPLVGTTFSGTTFKPNTGTQYEVGLKVQPPGMNSYATVAAFDLTQQNVLTTDFFHPNFSVQTGQVRSRGVELEVRANLAPGLNVIASASHVDAIVTRSNDANAGAQLFGVPRNLASLWVDRSFGEGSIFNGFGISGGVRYVGANFGDTATRVPSYTLFDAGARLQLGVLSNRLDRWRLALNATNLTNKRNFIICDAGEGCRYGFGRAVLGSLAYRW